MTYCLSSSCLQPEVQGQLQSCPSCGSALQLQGRYRALKLLGQGGFGRTFLAVDQAAPNQNRCVIKQFFPAQHQGKDQAAQLFRQEAQRLKGLKHHPQIPDLLDYFEVDQQQYLIQAFVDGSDLYQSISAGQGLPETEIIRLLQDLLPVVQFVHDHQIIHRDIKPANIIRRDRDQILFLVDLGAAKVATGTALAMTGTVIGSAEYTAPEQARGKATFASDIYSLGMTCLHLLTGVSPFNLYDVDEGRLAWKDYLKMPIGDRLCQILEGMTQEAVRQRYDSAEAVLRSLQPLTVDRQQLLQQVESTVPVVEGSGVAVAIAEPTASPLNLEAPGALANTQPEALAPAAEKSELSWKLAIPFSISMLVLWLTGYGDILMRHFRPSILELPATQSLARQGIDVARVGNSIPAPPPVELPSAPLDNAAIERMATVIPYRGSITLANQTPIATLNTVGELPRSLHLSSDGSLLISDTTPWEFTRRDHTGYVEAWNLETNEPIYQLPFLGEFKTLAIDDQSQTLLTQTLSERIVKSGRGKIPPIQAWNVRNGQPQEISDQIKDSYLMGLIPGDSERLEPGVITHDGRDVQIQGQRSGEVWFAEGVREIGTWNMVFKDGLIASAGWNAIHNVFNVTVLNPLTGEVKKNTSVGHYGEAYQERIRAEQSLNLKFSPDGKQLYIGEETASCHPSCLQTWDFQAIEEPFAKLTPLSIPAIPVHDFFFGPDPDQVILHIPSRSGIAPQIMVWSTFPDRPVKRILLGESQYPIAKTTRQISSFHNKQLPIEVGGTQEVAPVLLSDDGKTLFTAHEGEIKVWDFQALMDAED